MQQHRPTGRKAKIFLLILAIGAFIWLIAIVGIALSSYKREKQVEARPSQTRQAPAARNAP